MPRRRYPQLLTTDKTGKIVAQPIWTAPKLHRSGEVMDIYGAREKITLNRMGDMSAMQARGLHTPSVSGVARGAPPAAVINPAKQGQGQGIRSIQGSVDSGSLTPLTSLNKQGSVDSTSADIETMPSIPSTEIPSSHNSETCLVDDTVVNSVSQAVSNENDITLGLPELELDLAMKIEGTHVANVDTSIGGAAIENLKQVPPQEQILQELEQCIQLSPLPLGDDDALGVELPFDEEALDLLSSFAVPGTGVEVASTSDVGTRQGETHAQVELPSKAPNHMDLSVEGQLDRIIGLNMEKADVRIKQPQQESVALESTNYGPEGVLAPTTQSQAFNNSTREPAVIDLTSDDGDIINHVAGAALTSCVSDVGLPARTFTSHVSRIGVLLGRMTAANQANLASISPVTTAEASCPISSESPFLAQGETRSETRTNEARKAKTRKKKAWTTNDYGKLQKLLRLHGANDRAEISRVFPEMSYEEVVEKIEYYFPAAVGRRKRWSEEEHKRLFVLLGRAVDWDIVAGRMKGRGKEEVRKYYLHLLKNRDCGFGRPNLFQN